MAEIVGVVASGIAVTQLATGIINSAQKLRQIWREARDAPWDIEGALKEVDILDQSLLILQHGLENRAQEPNSVAVVERSLELCQKAAKNLNVIVSKLSVEPGTRFARRQKAKFKVCAEKRN